MNQKTVLYEESGAVAQVRLNRPQVLIAVNRQLVNDFLAVLREIEENSNIRVVILKGEGRAFCSGDDLSENQSFPSLEEGLQQVNRLQEVSRILLRMPKPVIASIHGYALGAGCEWAMNCDLRLAATETLFGFPETAVGMTVTNAGTRLLPLLVGLARAKELVFTGEKINAEQAEQWGLINRVVPLEKLEEAAFELAEKIVLNSSLSIALSKKSLNQGINLGFDEVLERETQDIALIIQTVEAAERSRDRLQQIKHNH